MPADMWKKKWHGFRNVEYVSLNIYLTTYYEKRKVGVLFARLPSM